MSSKNFNSILLAGAIGGLVGALVAGLTVSWSLRTRSIVATPLAPPAIGPYSQAVVHGDTVYVSGCIALDREGNMQGDTVEEQARAALTNMRHILEAAGSNTENVIKCTVLMADMADYGVVNQVYGEFFAAGKAPARAAFAVKGLPRNALVEIECIARVA